MKILNVFLFIILISFTACQPVHTQSIFYKIAETDTGNSTSPNPHKQLTIRRINLIKEYIEKYPLKSSISFDADGFMYRESKKLTIKDGAFFLTNLKTQNTKKFNVLAAGYSSPSYTDLEGLQTGVIEVKFTYNTENIVERMIGDKITVFFYIEKDKLIYPYINIRLESRNRHSSWESRFSSGVLD